MTTMLNLINVIDDTESEIKMASSVLDEAIHYVDTTDEDEIRYLGIHAERICDLLSAVQYILRKSVNNLEQTSSCYIDEKVVS